MGIKKERQSTFLTALKFEQSEKEARSLFAAKYFYRSSVVSECLCHLRANYPVQLPDICGG